MVEERIPSTRDKFGELRLRAVKSKSKRFKLRGEHYLERKIGAETDAVGEMGAELLIRPIMHSID